MQEDNRIMLVEDLKDFRQLLAAQLRNRHLEVIEFEDGLQAKRFLSTERPSVVLLDMNLPLLDGVELLKWMRGEDIQATVIMISGSEDELDRVLCLELGADDFLVKPFSARELLARIRAVQRRRQVGLQPGNPSSKALTTEKDNHAATARQIRAGRLMLDTERHRVELDGQLLELTTIEFRLLHCFMSQPQRVFSRAQLLDAAWGRDYVGYEQAVNNHILRLRRKIGDSVEAPLHIQTVKGVGYRFEP
jgi:two-component system alkaline phosphatase synthesis response regulator PhoP